MEIPMEIHGILKSSLQRYIAADEISRLLDLENSLIELHLTVP